MAQEFAWPGDSDLVLDLDGCVIDSVVVCGEEVMLEMRGGAGWIKEGDSIDVYGTHGVGEVTTSSFIFSTAHWDTADAARVIEGLRAWHGELAPIRLLCAPGKRAVVMYDNDDWFKLARLGEKSYAL